MGLPTNDYLRIISKSYGPRKPLVVCEASSLDMLADLDCAEGSTATVGGTEYVLDRVNGWVEPGGGGGGSDSGVLVLHSTYDESLDADVLDKTALEIISASSDGKVVIIAPTIPGMLLTTSYLSYVSQTKLGGAAFKFMRIDPTGQIGVITYTAGTADDYPVLNV